jgi:hypothetical protein
LPRAQSALDLLLSHRFRACFYLLLFRFALCIVLVFTMVVIVVTYAI